MKKILLLSTLFFLTNCKNITHQDYILDVNNQTKLPALEAVIDTTNLENVFSLGGFVANANNMGAAMAPAFCDTLLTHFGDTGRTPNYYDVIEQLGIQVTREE